MRDVPGEKTASSACSTPAAGLLVTLVGLGVGLLATDVIHASPERFHAPRWVVALAGLVFFFAGLLVAGQGLSRTARQGPAPLGHLLFGGFGMLVAAATIAFAFRGTGGGGDD